jgi:hypothetical protein
VVKTEAKNNNFDNFTKAQSKSLYRECEESLPTRNKLEINEAISLIRASLYFTNSLCGDGNFGLVSNP